MKNKFILLVLVVLLVTAFVMPVWLNESLALTCW